MDGIIKNEDAVKLEPFKCAAGFEGAAMIVNVPFEERPWYILSVGILYYADPDLFMSYPGDESYVF